MNGLRPTSNALAHDRKVLSRGHSRHYPIIQTAAMYGHALASAFHTFAGPNLMRDMRPLVCSMANVVLFVAAVCAVYVRVPGLVPIVPNPARNVMSLQHVLNPQRKLLRQAQLS